MPYDKDENYILPDSNRVEAPVEANVPLAVQMAALEPHLGYAGLVGLIEFLIEHWYEISREARTRIEEGYHQFGSQMYKWDAQRRRNEMVCEFADALVYLSSGEV